MIVFSLIAILKVLLPIAVKAGILFYGTKIGLKVAERTSEEIAEAINKLIFGEEGGS